MTMIEHDKIKDMSNRMAQAEVKGRSPWADARKRFFRNRAAMVALVVLVLIGLFAAFGNSIAHWSNDEIDFSIMGSAATLGGPSIENGHYFGTDDLGRDLFARTVQGTQISLMVGIVGAFVAVVVGTLYGATSGYIGGRTDQIMMRIVDILYSLPFMFFVIILMVVFGRNIILLFIALGAVEWLTMARIVRGQTLSVKRKEFIEAAHAAGVSNWRIVMRHIIPNVLGPVVVYVTLTVPEVIMTESFLSFLGLGVQEPYTSWGVLISEGAGQMESAPWMLIFPALFLGVTLFCFNFIGDGLRDALDPKDR